jgi:hypothetical protein
MGDGFITDISLSVKPSTPWVLNLSIFNTLGELLSPKTQLVYHLFSDRVIRRIVLNNIYIGNAFSWLKV